MNTSKGGTKTILIVAVVVIVILGGAFIGLLSWAQQSGTELQQPFFTAVLSGDANQVTALFHPALRAEVDEPVLAQWMTAVKAKLGGFKGLSKTDFSTSTEIKNGTKTTQSSGKVDFEKGSVHSELKFVDGKLVAFHVTPEEGALGEWFRDIAPEQSQFYRDRGQRFLTLFLTDKPDDAFGMMNDSLQKAAPLEKLKAMMATIAKQVGPMKSVECQSANAEGPGILKMLYQVRGEKGSTLASVKFEHDGMRYGLLGFNFNEKASTSEPAETPAERP